ncbi:MAG: DUF4364 family protein [Tissierellia bacterium]|nr:DUF4364 family protein [Tissierellia bacterium]
MKKDLQTLAQYKLVLLYILENEPTPFTNDSFTTYVLKNDIMNYFYFKQYLMELEASGLIEENDQALLQVTESGKEALGYFSHSIAKKLLNKAHQAQEDKEETPFENFSGSFIPPGQLELLAYNQDQVVFHLTLPVEGQDQAQRIIENFKAQGKKAVDHVLDYLDPEK